MAAEGIQFPWQWGSGTISTNLDVIWEMSAEQKVMPMLIVRTLLVADSCEFYRKISAKPWQITRHENIAFQSVNQGPFSLFYSAPIRRRVL